MYVDVYVYVSVPSNVISHSWRTAEELRVHIETGGSKQWLPESDVFEKGKFQHFLSEHLESADPHTSIFGD